MDRTMSTISLDPAQTARAVNLATAADAAMAQRIANLPDGEGPGLIELGLDAVLTKLRTDPQGFMDDNLDYLLLINDAMVYVTDPTGEPSERLLEWAPGL
jgi:hypothetical protein